MREARVAQRGRGCLLLRAHGGEALCQGLERGVDGAVVVQVEAGNARCAHNRRCGEFHDEDRVSICGTVGRAPAQGVHGAAALRKTAAQGGHRGLAVGARLGKQRANGRSRAQRLPMSAVDGHAGELRLGDLHLAATGRLEQVEEQLHGDEGDAEVDGAVRACARSLREHLLRRLRHQALIARHCFRQAGAIFTIAQQATDLEVRLAHHIVDERGEHVGVLGGERLRVRDHAIHHRRLHLAAGTVQRVHDDGASLGCLRADADRVLGIDARARAGGHLDPCLHASTLAERQRRRHVVHVLKIV